MATPIRKIPAKKTLGIIVGELRSGFKFCVELLLVFLVVSQVLMVCNALIVFSSHGELIWGDVADLLTGLLVTGALCYWGAVAIVFAVLVPICVITRILVDK